MKALKLNKAFLEIEKGPVVLVTTSYKKRDNVMTISWISVIDFSPRFALCTGSWNYSYEALVNTKECVIAVPGVDLLDRVIEAGNFSGSDCDKFKICKFKKSPASKVSAPLLSECLSNIECRVVDHIKKHDIFILEALAAWTSARRERRAFHAVGDGIFIADGEKFDRRNFMQKIPGWLL